MEGLVGKVAEVKEDFIVDEASSEPGDIVVRGRVFVHGEYWNAIFKPSQEKDYSLLHRRPRIFKLQVGRSQL